MRKRKEKERRQIGKPVSFPITDSSGCVVLFNRSRLAERQLNNYVLKEMNGEEYLLACIESVLGTKQQPIRE
jgi:hypothetical protein